MSELDRAQRTGKGIEEFSTIRAEFIDRIVAAYDVEMLKMVRLNDQLVEVKRIWEEDNYDTTELTEALEEELEELRARRDADLELSQVGMALNSISHEFEKTVGSLRDGLRRLKAWADANHELAELYQDYAHQF